METASTFLPLLTHTSVPLMYDKTQPSQGRLKCTLLIGRRHSRIRHGPISGILFNDARDGCAGFVGHILTVTFLVISRKRTIATHRKQTEEISVHRQCRIRFRKLNWEGSFLISHAFEVVLENGQKELAVSLFPGSRNWSTQADTSEELKERKRICCEGVSHSCPSCIFRCVTFPID